MKKTILVLLCLILTLVLTIIPVFASNIAISENIDTYSPTFKLIGMSNNGMYQNPIESYVFTYDTSGIAVVDFARLDEGGEKVQWQQNNSFYENGRWADMKSYNSIEVVAPQTYKWRIDYNTSDISTSFYGNNLTFFYDSFTYSKDYVYYDIPNINLRFSVGNQNISATYDFDYSIYDLVTNEIVTGHKQVKANGNTSSTGAFGLQAVDFNTLNNLADNSSNKMIYVQNLTVNVNANSPSGQPGESGNYPQLTNLVLNHIIDKNAPTTLTFFETFEREEHGLFDFIITSIGGFFGTDLFGTFSLGDLTSIVISIGVLFALLKYFAGG